ncbi:unnamed protein product [marine sediment metagenome]|uniref:Uncharacterized protein n=1 Tax=marine sediment metagenome TaxID=412755 RepID=X0STT7_9ZZZZ
MYKGPNGGQEASPPILPLSSSFELGLIKENFIHAPLYIF